MTRQLAHSHLPEVDETGHTVVVIEDSDTQRALLRRALEQAGYQVEGASNGTAGIDLLSSVRPDIVLLDVVMPDMDGWETLEQIRSVSGVPVIMLTAENSQQDLVRGLRTGADDYMSKPFGPEELAARIEAVLRRSSEARSDALTGLPNQRSFGEHLDTTLRTARSSGGQVALVLFDLDDFKQINDTKGHPEGDRVLRAVARVVLRHVRLGEEAFRIGGEEFAIVIAGGLEDGLRVAERVRSSIAGQQREGGLPTLSAGVAAFPGQANSRDELVHRSDLALYAAKHQGKNRAIAFEPALEGDVS
jgi:diguanylate cyclase (GGDEF)-like protein